MTKVAASASATPAPAAAPAAAPPPSRSAFTPDLRGIGLAKALLRDDFAVWFNGGNATIKWESSRPVDVRMKATALVADYDANEVAADEKYKDKTLAVTGRIDQIGKDAFGAVFLELKGDGMFKSVHAFLGEDAARGAGKLQKGTSITLICDGMGMVLMSPVLKNCESSADIIAAEALVTDAAIDRLFRSEPSNLGSDSDRMAATAYLLAKRLPAGSGCFHDGPLPQSCSKDLEAAMKDYPKDQRATDYDALAALVALPPRPKADAAQ